MKTKVVIALGTFKRPKMFADALRSLSKIKLPGEVIAKVLAIDNDENGESKGVFDEVSQALKVPAEYSIEKVKGIVPMRNHALHYALQDNAEYLAFFDDDEEVDPLWLLELISTAEKYGANAVHGRAIYQLPNEVDQWIKEDSYFNQEAKLTGTVRKGASTNNCLIDLDFVRKKSIEFEMSLNQIGASDTYFFGEIVRKGGKIVWANEAITYEKVPLSRANETWILKRAYKVGFARFHRLKLEKGYLLAAVETILFSLKLLMRIIGRLNSLRSVDMGKRIKTKKVWQKMKGGLSAMIGFKYYEYKKIHGE